MTKMTKFTVKWSAHTMFGGTYTGERTVHAQNAQQAARHVRTAVKREAFPDVPVKIESVTHTTHF